MKIYPVTFHNKFIKNSLNVVNIKTDNNYQKKIQEEKPDFPIVSAKLALISFYGDKKIKPSSRLENSDYKISNYIAEISKARYLHGDRAVVDMSMGNPDLTPPEKAKQALKDKVNDLGHTDITVPKEMAHFFIQ